MPYQTEPNANNALGVIHMEAASKPSRRPLLFDSSLFRLGRVSVVASYLVHRATDNQDFIPTSAPFLKGMRQLRDPVAATDLLAGRGAGLLYSGKIHQGWIFCG